MEKKERFVVIAFAKLPTGETNLLPLEYLDGYPTDEMLETVWVEAKQRIGIKEVYWLKVEKQMRFE